MKYRTTTLYALTNEGTAGTKTIDINVADPISALIFLGKITMSTGARLIPEPDVMSKIELVDGSDVILSLSGTEMAALGFYEGHPFIDWASCSTVSDTEEGYLRYDFGRKLWDPLLALDPKRFKNPQLKITFNTAAVQAAATPFYLSVIAECFDEKAIAPVGFLSAREHHSYVGGATTWEYIDLPTDQVLRKLYLQTKDFGAAYSQLLTEAKLDEDNGKRIPFDLLAEDWADLDIAKFGRLHQYCGALSAGASYPNYGAPCIAENANVVNASAQGAFQCTLITGGKFAFAAGASNYVMIGELSGALPYFVYCYPFGDQDDPDDWYDTTKVGSLRFIVESGSVGASATYNTIVQQLRKY